MRRLLTLLTTLFLILGEVLFSSGYFPISKVYPGTVSAKQSTQEQKYGVFPLVRKNQAFEWRDSKWQLKPGFIELLNKDYISGITYYDPWSNIEPEPGKYNWGFINQIVAAVKERGKTVNLGIAASQFSPEWIYDQGVISRSYHNSITDSLTLAPLPWDNKYLELYIDLIKNLGRILKDSANFYSPVKRIMIGGPTNTLGFEMIIDGSYQDQQYYLETGYPEEFVTA